MKSLLFIITLFFTILLSPSLHAQIWSEVVKAVASDRGAGDFFGFSVSISGDYAIVGAYLHDGDSSGGTTLLNSGSAYIFRNNGGVWTEVQKIEASDVAVGDHFGASVSISGEYAIVGAFREDEDSIGGATLLNAGSAYIFKNNGGVWTEVQKIVASDREEGDQFGWSVSLSEHHAIVGANFEDADTTGGLTVPSAGSAYIFQNNGGIWTEVQKIVPSDRGANDQFGASVSISEDYTIVGAFLEDGDSIGGTILSDAGSAYIFQNNGSVWTEVQKISAQDRGSDDQFGYSVSISGDHAIVGANFEDEDPSGGSTLPFAGSAYIFKNNGGTWTEVQKLVASDRAANDWFGQSVSISGDFAIVGAPIDDEDANGGAFLNNAGSSYIYQNIGGTWTEIQKLVASDRDEFDYFGNSVSISGGYAIVGAHFESHGTSGGGFLSVSGSAYIFERCISEFDTTVFICSNDSILLTSNLTNAIWYQNGNQIANGPYFYAPGNSNNIFVAQGLNACGDLRIDTFRVQLDLSTSISKSLSKCENEPLQLNSSLTNTFWLENGNQIALGSSFTFGGTSNTTVIAKGLNSNRCPQTDTFKIEINFSTPSSKSLFTCQNDSILLNSNLTNTIWLQSGNQLDSGSSFIASGSDNNVFIAKGLNSFGCVQTDTFSVQINPLPQYLLADITILCKNISDTLPFQLITPSTVEWSEASLFEDPFAVPPIVKPISNNYNISRRIITIVTITSNANGCKVSDSIELVIKPDDCAKVDLLLKIPNVVTFNGDGFNDKFHIENLHLYPDNKLWIFNRAGRPLLKTNNYDNKWPYEELSSGIYFYQLFIKDEINEFEFKGFIHLMN